MKQAESSGPAATSVEEDREASAAPGYSPAASIDGRMEGTFEIEGDIIGPQPGIWNAMNDSAPR